jgi:hypothetical protein
MLLLGVFCFRLVVETLWEFNALFFVALVVIGAIIETAFDKVELFKFYGASCLE